MAEGTHREIEFKYLIRRPEEATLEGLPGCEVWQIEQTYLTEGEGDETRRVRKVVSGDATRYFRTFKRFIDRMSSAEDEAEIDRDAYEALLDERDPESTPILKTRYRVPYGGHVLEFDIYPFWSDRAVLEIELEREDEVPAIPEWVRIIRDVTGEPAYKNRMLARHVPMDEI